MTYERIRSVARAACAAVLCLGVLVDLGSIPGHAATTAVSIDVLKTPMQVMLVRSSDPRCDGHCSDWIAMQGPIGRGSFAAFSQLLQKMGNRKLPILINSPGGAVEEAIAIGRLIHARHLDVAVTKTVLASCPGDRAACGTITRGGLEMGEPDADHAFCASACPFILAGGVHRFVAPWTFVGLHQFIGFRTQTRVMRTFRILTREVDGVKVEVSRTLIGERPLGKTTSRVSPDYSRAKAYLAEMGVSGDALALVEHTPPTGMYWLTRSDLVATKLDTEGRDGQYLVRHAGDSVAAADTGAPLGRGVIALTHAAAATPTEQAFLVAPRSLGTANPVAGTVRWQTETARGDAATAALTLSAKVDLSNDEGRLALSVDRTVDEGRCPQLRLAVTLRPGANGYFSNVRAIGSPELRTDITSDPKSVDGLVTISTANRFEMMIPSKAEGEVERLLSQAAWIDIPILIDGAETIKVSFARGASGDQAMRAWRAVADTRAAGRSARRLIVGAHENPPLK